MKRTFTLKLSVSFFLLGIVFFASCNRSSIQANKSLQEKANRSIAAAPGTLDESIVASNESIVAEEQEAVVGLTSTEEVKSEKQQIDLSAYTKSSNLSFAEKAAVKMATKKLQKMERKSIKEGKAVNQGLDFNQYIIIGLVLVLIGIVIGWAFGPLGWLATLIGVILIIYGLLIQL